MSNKSKGRATMSVVMPTPINEEIERIAGAENINKTALIRRLLYTGLKYDHGIHIRNNRIVSERCAPSVDG